MKLKPGDAVIVATPYGTARAGKLVERSSINLNTYNGYGDCWRVALFPCKKIGSPRPKLDKDGYCTALHTYCKSFVYPAALMKLAQTRGGEER